MLSALLTRSVLPVRNAMHVPMIAFRYGVRTAVQSAVRAQSNGATAAPVASAVAAATANAAAKPAATVYTKRSLPGKFRPRPLSDDELDFVRFGGADGYVLPVKGAKPAAGGKPAKK